MITKHSTKIFNIANGYKKIYKTNNNKLRKELKSILYKTSFTTKYLINNTNKSYYTSTEIILKNRTT